MTTDTQCGKKVDLDFPDYKFVWLKERKCKSYYMGSLQAQTWLNKHDCMVTFKHSAISHQKCKFNDWWLVKKGNW